MTTTAIKSMLRAAIFTGAIGFIPTVALADGDSMPRGTEATGSVPDHGAAEARGAGEAFSALGAEPTRGIPDHATAEARSAGDEVSTTGTGTTERVPDHAAAEAGSTNQAESNQAER